MKIEIIQKKKEFVLKQNIVLFFFFEKQSKQYQEIWNEMQQYKITENSYTNHTLSTVEDLKKRLEDAVAARNAAYQKELQHQKGKNIKFFNFFFKNKIRFFKW